MECYEKMKVEVVCTTDDPIDDLKYHQQLSADGFEIKILPTFRPDAAMAVQDPVTFTNYVHKLVAVSGNEISSFDHYLQALKQRHDFFHQMGGRLSDHGLNYIDYSEYTDAEVSKTFIRLMDGKTLRPKEG